MSKATVFMVSGDASGDVHASYVIQALKRFEPHISVQGIGGQKMAQAGMVCLAGQQAMGRVGLWGFITAVPSHLKLARQFIAALKKHRQEKPDEPVLVLLVDYGGFNLRLAQWIQNHPLLWGVPIHYYIPPQVWASRPKRLETIRKTISKVYCIFPFEETLYQQQHIPVQYVGHPLLGQLPQPLAGAARQAFFQQHYLDENRPVVALFPGSRRMELAHLLQPMLGAAARLQQEFPEVQWVVSQADNLSDAAFRSAYRKAFVALGSTPVTLIKGHSQALMSVAHAAMVASGTATLEAALYRLPMIIAYKGPWLSYVVAKKLIQLPCLGLPNILCGPSQPIVPELLQQQVTAKNLTQAMAPLLQARADNPLVSRMTQGFSRIHQLLAPPPHIGSLSAAEGVASDLLKTLTVQKLGRKTVL